MSHSRTSSKSSAATKQVEAQPGKMEEQLGSAIHRCEKAFHTQWHKVEEWVRDSPTAAVLIAAGVGHCLRRLPVRSLLATQFRLAWALAPPALLALAASKAYQAVEERISHSDSAPAPRLPAGK